MLEGQLRSQNLHSAILYDIFKHGMVERAHFHALSSHFLKENLFEGVPVRDLQDFLVSKDSIVTVLTVLKPSGQNCSFYNICAKNFQEAILLRY